MIPIAISSVTEACVQLGIRYTVTTDCLMVHRILSQTKVKLDKDYSSIVTVYKSIVETSNDV